METADLVKTLLKAEEDCRTLRDEVATLERTRRFKARDELSIAPPSTDTSTVSRNGKGGRSLPLPIEAVGELNSKAGEVTLLMRENKKLLRERKQLEKILAESAAQAEAAKDENMELKRRIGCSDGDSLERLKGVAEAVAYTNGLKHDILMSLRDREAIQTTLKRQTEYLRQLASDLEATRNLEEERDNAAKQLSKKRDELYRIREEVQSMRRLLENKDKQLEKEKPVDELALAKSAETDRRVVMHKLEKEQEAVRLNDMSIRHRALQIAKLEKRIEMIGNAIEGESDAEQERVDVELLEKLRKEIIQLSRLQVEGESRLEKLDANVADLDRRAIGLARTTNNVEKEMKRIEKEHRKITNAHKKEMELEQAAAEQDIRAIEEEIEMLRQVTSRHGNKTSRR